MVTARPDQSRVTPERNGPLGPFVIRKIARPQIEARLAGIWPISGFARRILPDRLICVPVSGGLSVARRGSAP